MIQAVAHLNSTHNIQIMNLKLMKRPKLKHVSYDSDVVTDLIIHLKTFRFSDFYPHNQRRSAIFSETISMDMDQ